MCRPLRAALASGYVHPLAAIARFIVQFLAIHPFQDGNGRVSRALTTLLLLKAGYDYVPYSSLERVVEENKSAYFRRCASRRPPCGWTRPPSGSGFSFCCALQAQKKNLEAKLEVEQSMLHLTEAQQEILALIDQHGRTTTTFLATLLEMPVRTVRYHLDILVAQRLVEARGERRGRFYTRSAEAPARIVSPASPTAAILAEILERGGRIGRSELIRLVKRYGYDPRVVRTMHGRRLAHLRRDRKTGHGVLTIRGQEIAEQHLFTERLARVVRLQT